MLRSASCRGLLLFMTSLGLFLVAVRATSAESSLPDTRADYRVSGGGPTSLAQADFNGDGVIDLIVAGNAIATVFIGRGDGTFRKQGEIPGASAGQVLAGDFDNDGRVDLVIASAGGYRIHLGNGDGTFRQLPAQSIGVSNSNGGLAAGDFNHDGTLDLALPTSQGVAVLLGNGDGTFQPARQYTVGTAGNGRTVEVTSGDYDGDGHADLAVIGNSVLAILRGVGDGSFVSVATYATSYTQEGVKTADFNKDGKLDLATVNYGNSDSLQVYLGNGDGTFRPPSYHAGGDVYPYALDVADLDGDGNVDVIVGGCVVLGLGNGTFRPPVCYPIQPRGADGIVVADFNGDRIPDVAMGERFGRSSGGFFGVFIGTGDGSFRQPRTYVVGNAADGVVVGDFNEDGIPDIATANYSAGSVSVMLGAGNGTFLPGSDHSVGQGAAAIVTADFNGDGHLDIAVANEAGGTPSVSIVLGNGDGTFRASVNYPVSSATSLTVGDFDNDGRLDLAVYGADRVSLLRGNGDGAFQSVASFPAGGWAYTVFMDRNGNWITSGDFNRDGRLDLAITDYLSGHGVTIYLGNGDFTFQYGAKYSVGGYPYCVTTGDFNGDGILDLATADAGQDFVSVLIGVGDGTFRPAVQYRAGLNPVFVTSGDFDGDGTLDLAVSNVYSNNVSILSGTGDGTFAEARSFGTLGARASASGDFDGDGVADLVVAGQSSVTLLAVPPVRHTLMVTTAGDGTGTVTSSPEGIACGATCAAAFDQSATVTLTAAPGGQTTLGWSGCDTTAGSHCTVTMTGPRAVTATFTRFIVLTVLRSGSGTGTLTITPLPISPPPVFCLLECYAFPAGTEVTLTATPIAGSAFTGWSGGGCSGTGTCTITGDASVTATFEPIAGALLVTSLTPIPSGFAVHFNRPLDPSGLNLYGTQTGGEGPADVTLTGDAHGPIRGTLIVDADAGAIAFVKTGEPLLADRYAVRLRSATNGFKDRDGRLLDGNGDGIAGDDYEGTFTVAAPPSLVLSVPDFARGPGQAVDVPAMELGTPVRLSDASGVALVSFRLTYDPALLEIIEGLPGVDLPLDALVLVSVDEPGRASATVSLPTPPPASGPLQLVRIRGRVPANAPYRAKHLLHLDQVAVNEGALPVLADDGVHLVAYVGDTTGNGAYSSLDAQRVLRVAVGLDSGFAKFPLVDPAIIGDITANGAISSLDATRILQEVVGQDRPEIPPVPGVVPPVFASGPDPLVTIPRRLRATLGGAVTVPVVIDDADGLEAVDLTIAVDPSVFEIVDVRAGSVMLDGLVVSKIDAEAGTVTVAVAVTIPRGPGGGSLVQLDLRVRAGASPRRSLIDLQGASLNERGLTLGLMPRPGPDATDGTVMVED